MSVEGPESYSNPAYDDVEVIPNTPHPTTPQPEKGALPAETNGVHPSAVVSDADPSAGNKASLDDDLERKEQELRDREPLKFCKLLVKYPKSFFALFLGCHVLSLLTTMTMVVSGYDILPIVFDALPLDMRDDPDYLRGLAWDYRWDTDPNLIYPGYNPDASNQSALSEVYDVIQFLYLNSDRSQNVLTKAGLQAIQNLENDFYTMAGYQSDHCFKPQDGGPCMKPRSLVQYFDGTFAMVDPVFNDPNFDDIANVIYTASTNNLTVELFQYFKSDDAVLNASGVFMSATRSQFFVGYPLPGYQSVEDDLSQQESDTKQYYLKTLMPKGDGYYASGVGNMDFLYGSQELVMLYITQQVVMDMALVIGSFVFILIFICIQTQSLWVSFLAIGSILTGFTGANLLYNVVFGFRYFGVFHVLAIFIILGIGADDVFVFYDNWKETAFKPYKSLEHRLSDCYRKASMAMMFTSLTTSLAFFTSATSPLLAIYSFGVFSGTLVIVNYISVITFFPAAVIMYHKYFEKYKCCCCCPTMSSSVSDTDTVVVKEKKNFVVRFFGGPYYRFVTHKIARWVMLVVYVVIFVVFLSFATQLQVEEEPIEFLSEDTLIGKYLKAVGGRYSSFDDFGTKIYLVWGLQKQSRDGCHHSDPDCPGSTVFDDNFDLNSAAAQQDLVDLCDTIRNLDDATIKRLHIKENLVSGVPEVLCFIDDQKTFNQDMGMAFPVTRTSADSLMTARSDIYTTALSNNVMTTRHYEVGMSYWLYNDSSVTTLHAPNIGEATTDDTVDTMYNGEPYSYGNRLRFVALVVNTTLDSRSLSYLNGLPIRDAWEEWMDAQVATMSAPLRGGFQVTPEDNVWHSIKIQQKLVQTAIIGIIVGIAIACPILIFATHNILVGLLATLIIACITVSVVGVIPAGGWRLGVLESLNLVLVVGLAVDYVVHLAEGYSRSTHHGRLERTQQMLEEVGISVISGACTTLGASMFLLPAKILFFTQFGIFMFSTIGFSLLYALGLFSTIVGLCGPQGTTGSIKDCCKPCRKSNEA